MNTLKRRCAPLTEDHTDKMEGQFRSIKQSQNEIATSYFNRLRALRRECYHAGIEITLDQLFKRAIRGANSHPAYDTTYKSYERKMDDARIRGTSIPEFSELEDIL